MNLTKTFMGTFLVWAVSSILHLTTPSLFADNSTSDTTLSVQAKTLTGGLQLYQPKADANVENLGVHDTYLEAQNLEAEIVQMYREIRAAELSLIQRQTLDRSLESTLTPLSQRAKVNVDVLNKTSVDAEDIEAYQKELGIVMRETDSIVANAQDLLNSFNKEMPVEPPPPSKENQTDQSQSQDQQDSTVTETNESEMSSEKQQKLDTQVQEMKEDIKKNIDEAEMNLTEALQEMKKAQEKVDEAQKENQEKIEELKKELAETKEEKKDVQKEEELKKTEQKKEKLEKLDEQVKKATKKVEETIEIMAKKEENKEPEIEETKKLVKEVLAALAEALEADTQAKKENQTQTAEHTTKAVEKMDQASKKLEEATKMMETLAEMKSSSGPLSADKAIAQKQALGEFSKAGAGGFIDLTDIMKGKNIDVKLQSVAPENRPTLWEGDENENFPSIRKVVSEGTWKGTWSFIGDWYVLSRYDNAQRANLTKVYPPESILDLNARYASEDGLPMQWTYESFEPPMITPTYWESWKIYYFYTELYFEKASDLWIAIGSDDRSDIWINDLPVWHSANQHKGWNPKEGFRKVHFVEGRNKILLRLENGHFSMGFSLYLNTPAKSTL